MAISFDQIERFSDEALLEYLTRAAAERDEALAIGQYDGQWVAEIQGENPLAGEVAPMPSGEGAVTLPDRIASESSGPSPDRRSAMLLLAHLLAGHYSG